MRCLSCNVGLTDFEATRKSAITGEHFDLCNRCFASIKDQVTALERYDLEHMDSDSEDHDDEEPLDKDF